MKKFTFTQLVPVSSYEAVTFEIEADCIGNSIGLLETLGVKYQPVKDLASSDQRIIILNTQTFHGSSLEVERLQCMVGADPTDINIAIAKLI